MLLSIRAEGLFYVCFCVVLGLWVGVEEGVRGARGNSVQKEAEGGVRKEGEGAVQGESEDASKGKVVRKMEGKGMREGGWNPMGLRGDDVRIAMFFLFFVQVGFFGTGK